MAMQQEELYEQRFADVSQQKRAALWAVLCDVVLQRYIDPTDTVVDLGAGFCEFINTIRCDRKVAIDANPAVKQHAAEDVSVVVGDVATVLARIGDATVNAVFCSNFFEHLGDKAAVLDVLRHVRRILVAGGRLIVIQPNIRYAYKEYWDFFDHHVALSDKSFSEALQLTGFRIQEMYPRFLPYTTTGRLPQAPWLLRLYLGFRPAQWCFGKQMLVMAQKPA